MESMGFLTTTYITTIYEISAIGLVWEPLTFRTVDQVLLIGMLINLLLIDVRVTSLVCGGRNEEYKVR